MSLSATVQPGLTAVFSFVRNVPQIGMEATWSERCDKALHYAASVAVPTNTADFKANAATESARCLNEARAAFTQIPITPDMVETLAEIGRYLGRFEKALHGDFSSRSDEHLIGLYRSVRSSLRAIENKCEKYTLGIVREIQDSLKKIYTLQCEVKALTDVSLVCGDGFMRTNLRFCTPSQLQNRRTSLGLNPEECELVIIGGGPAGIASSYYAGKFKLDTVLFEGGFIAQGMSDARAGDVHVMRTGIKGRACSK